MTSTPASISNRPTLTAADTALAGLPVEVGDTIEGCRRLREPWLRMRERCGVQSPNTDPDRFVAVVGALPDALPHVVMFGSRESPRALLVARSSRRRVAYRLGYTGFRSPTLRCLDVVYEGLLTDTFPGFLPLVVAYLTRRLRRGDFDLVSFNHLRLAQAQYLTNRSTSAVADEPEPHWRFELLPGSCEQSIQPFSKKHRYNIRRADRLLVDFFGGKVCLRAFTSAGEVDDFLSRAAQITAQSYQGRLKIGLRNDRVTREALCADARAGRLRCYWLEANTEPIAHQVGYIDGDAYHLAATSFLPQYGRLSPGQVLLVRVIEDLSTIGVRCIDYGFGDADYKRIYGTESWPEQSVRLYGRTARATLARMLDVATTRGAAWLRTAAEQLGAIRRIKNTWRRRLTRDHGR